MKRLTTLLIPVILICVLLNSCTNDPVIPPEDPPVGFDSARYEWTVDTLSEYIQDIGGFDTTQICFLTPNSLLTYDGTKYSSYPITMSNFIPVF